MISNFFYFVNTKGSSLALPANGLGGSRATSFLVAHFALQNTASNPAEKNRAKPEKQKGKKEGGWGEGIFARPRFSAAAEFRILLRKMRREECCPCPDPPVRGQQQGTPILICIY